MKDNCYRGRKGELGIHRDFYMKLIGVENPIRGYNIRKLTLNVDRPTSYAEAELLVEFVFGTKLKVEIVSFTNRLLGNWGFSDKQSTRDISLARLSGDDFLFRIDEYAGSKCEVKRDLAHFRWEIGKGTPHHDYIDHEFNKITLNSSYVIETVVVPCVIFGPRCSGGIGYGDCTIQSFTELDRMKVFWDNRHNEARPEYILYIENLKKINKTYRYNDLKIKIKNYANENYEIQPA